MDECDPQCWDDLLLPDAVKKRLDTFRSVAKSSGDPLSHLLLVGPPAVGKRTLARVLAQETGVGIKVACGEDVQQAGDLAGILTTLERGDVFFIEHIDKMAGYVQECLTAAARDFKLDIIIDQGPDARSVRLNLPRFTLIGTTDDPSRLPASLLDEFLAVCRLSPLSAAQIATVLRRYCRARELSLEPNAAENIGRLSRSRISRAFTLLWWVRRYCSAHGCSSMDEHHTAEALAVLGPDGVEREPETSMVTQDAA
jgi:holliday junction DNA helicase RuvB